MCTGGYLCVHWWVLVCALVGTCMCTGGYFYVHWWVLVCALVGTCMCTGGYLYVHCVELAVGNSVIFFISDHFLDSPQVWNGGYPLGSLLLSNKSTPLTLSSMQNVCEMDGSLYEAYQLSGFYSFNHTNSLHKELVCSQCS